MPQIHEDNQPVTQITVVESEPGMQADALSLMMERARFMARQPGFISISLHRSQDGRRIVNYIQWQSRELLHSAHHSPEFRAEWRHFDELTRDIEPQLYDVALVIDGAAAAPRKRARVADSRKSHAKRAPGRSSARKSARARVH
jgi:heme-degrading monooxygenase HmoA